MLYKKLIYIYGLLYGGFILLMFLSAITYNTTDIFAGFITNMFLFLLLTIFISFASFLSILFSSERFTLKQYKILLIIHGGYFLFAMTIYRIMFY